MTTSQNAACQILIGGIGNIFWGDDGFGVEVVRRLAERPLPPVVRVVDFGIRGMDLTYALLEPYAAIILIDAMPRGGAPGTLYVIEPDDEGVTTASDALSIHELNPLKSLRLARQLGGLPPRLVVVGCEPASIGEDDEMRMGLSPAVERAVEDAVRLVESLVERLRSESDAPLSGDRISSTVRGG